MNYPDKVKNQMILLFNVMLADLAKSRTDIHEDDWIVDYDAGDEYDYNIHLMIGRLDDELKIIDNSYYSIYIAKSWVAHQYEDYRKNQ